MGSRVGLAGVCLLAVVLSARGITNESAVSLHGDMPKYLMNGVYMLDLLRDRPVGGVDTFLEYTRHYFARYPALSLGHHPPLTSALEVPMFAVFGISVAAARTLELFCLVAAVAGLFLLVRAYYGALVASLAGLFMATSPMIVLLGQSVLSEIPTLALVIWSAYFLQRFCATEQRWALVGFAAAATLSLYAKQLAIVVFPAYLLTAVTALGVRRLLGRDVVVAAAAIAIGAFPLVPMTLLLSTTNVSGTVAVWQRTQHAFGGVLRSALADQFSAPVLVVIAAGVVRAIVSRDGRALLFVAWGATGAAGIVLVGQYEPARHGIYWVPALCALAAASVTGWRSKAVTAVMAGLALAAAGHQTLAASRVSVVGAAGYEEAAQFVLASDPGSTVLFSGDVDTGFFTFFVRKHDADRALVVLRSDKILTTSFLGRPSVVDRITEPSEIYTALRRFGTRYVVIEDRPSRSSVQEWLRQELLSARFAERWRKPIGTTDPRLRGTSLAIYEFLDAGRPDPEAVLSMDLPIIGKSVAVKLSDLIARKYLR